MSDAITESSACQDWGSPPELVDPIHDFLQGAPGLDPCGRAGSIVGAGTEFRNLAELPPDGRKPWLLDGLAEGWTGYGAVYANHPFGRELAKWAAKCAAEHERGAEVLELTPARPGTGWWRKSVLGHAAAVCFWSGRLKFLHPDGATRVGAPFDAALIYYGERVGRFVEMFDRHGWCVRRAKRVRLHVEAPPEVTTEWRAA